MIPALRGDTTPDEFKKFGLEEGRLFLDATRSEPQLVQIVDPVMCGTVTFLGDDFFTGDNHFADLNGQPAFCYGEFSYRHIARDDSFLCIGAYMPGRDTVTLKTYLRHESRGRARIVTDQDVANSHSYPLNGTDLWALARTLRTDKISPGRHLEKIHDFATGTRLDLDHRLW